jgi:predicted ABC-type transport system involved in lysophospholipase L1 biosynthesis ATPase subunit
VKPSGERNAQSGIAKGTAGVGSQTGPLAGRTIRGISGRGRFGLRQRHTPTGYGNAAGAATFKYGSTRRWIRALTVALANGDVLDVARGERVALLGKSGSGKSTLLNLLGGLDRPTAGGLTVAGRDLGRLPGRELSRFRSAAVGMIFQSFNLILSRTALENVELPMVFAGVSPRARRAEARRALVAVGLGERLEHRPAQLSGGESQRVAVARALVNRPQVLLADEPTGNLDSATARDVVTLIREHVASHGTTLILVTHDEELAASCTDRVLRLKDGQLVD